MYVYVYICIYACLSACLSVCLSVRLSVCLSVCLSLGGLDAEVTAIISTDDVKESSGRGGHGYEASSSTDPLCRHTLFVDGPSSSADPHILLAKCQ